jgi:hypothetical protein
MRLPSPRRGARRTRHGRLWRPPLRRSAAPRLGHDAAVASICDSSRRGRGPRPQKSSAPTRDEFPIPQSPDGLGPLHLDKHECRCNCLWKSKDHVIVFCWPDSRLRPAKGSVGEKGTFSRFAQPETRVARETGFFWICRNALKRPNSAKGIQGNASFFAWIPLVFLALIWRPFAFRLYRRRLAAELAGRAFRQALSFSPKPAASMARWVLFWKLASWPAAKRGTASAIARQTASTQPASDLAKSFRT